MKRLLVLVTVITSLSSASAATVRQLSPCSSPSFKAAPSFNISGGCCGNDLQGVASGDLNNDGRTDIVTANGSSNTVSVLLGSGQSFSPAVNYPVAGAGRPFSVAVGDFNKDGKADVVTANTITENLSILLGDGAGGLGAATHVRAGTDPIFVMTADFNGDGNLDLAAASSDTASVNVLLGNGAGGFGSFSSFTAGSSPRALVAADFNLDGKLDLAAVNRGSNNVSILIGDGAGGFAAMVPFNVGMIPEHLATGDFNSDGKTDLVVANYGSFNVSVHIGIGDGRFGTATNLSVGSPVNSVAVGDFNNDGNMDIATGPSASGVYIRLGDGAGNFGVAKRFAVLSGPLSLLVSDYNRDGSDDLLVANLQADAIILLAGDGAGNFATAPSYTTGTNVISTALADFNGDGKLDVALANENTNTVSVRLGSGTGAFGNAINFAVGTRPYWVSVGDFNNDGKADLVTANFLGGNLSVLLGDGAGGFGPASNIALNSPVFNPWFVRVSDVNSDGKADLLALRLNRHDVTVLLGDGAGGFGNQVNFATGFNPQALAVGDFNGDGKIDLAVTDNSLSVLLGDGAGGFGVPINTHFGENTGPGAIVAADFNGDGKLDVVLANESTSNVSLLIGDGTGKFAPRVNFKVGIRPSALEVGDFNGDGKIDISVANLISQNVGILLGDGAGGFNLAASWAVPTFPSTLSVGDLDGDGRTDITAAGSNVLAVLLNTCGDTVPLPDALISVNDVTITEADAGNLNAVFDVTLATASTQTVTTKFFTSAVDAKRGEDFQAVSGTLNFAPGVTKQTVSIPIVGDATDEFNERFILNIYEPVNALIADRQGMGTITDNDLEPSISIGNASALEGQSPNAFSLLVSLSHASGKLVTVVHTTADGTATAAGGDYISKSGTLTVPAGGSSGVINVQVVGDSINEPDETFFINLSNPVNASVPVARGVGTIINDDTTKVQFTATAFAAGEGSGQAIVMVTRTGDLSGPTSVEFSTTDDSAAVPCDPTLKRPDGTSYPQGVAYARCDYATTIETVTFAAGDSQSKTVNIPLIDDAHVEGAETVQVKLLNPTGALLGTQSTATLTINDNNDVTGVANPIFSTPFFVRMHYLDFLSREPEPGEPWSGVLSGCANPFNLDSLNPSAACDRIIVSQSFFGSPEFRLKGFYVFNFYRVAFDRRPEYAEIIPDMRGVTGATAAEVYAKRAALAASFTGRAEFKARYDGLSDTAFVNALLDPYGLQQITAPDAQQPEGGVKVVLTRAELVTRLGAATQGLTRAQVLRAVVESDEVVAVEYKGAFVAMQYYGYLRRTPEESGYQAWLKVINEDPNNIRIMVNGFMNSTEYRLRFGQP